MLHLAFAWLLLALPGCFNSMPCGEEESCDFADNDCDRRIDEDFLNEDGVYATLEHCGGCGVNCPDVFPTAEETACEIDTSGAARCVLLTCAPGFHPAGEGACAPDVPVLCAPCATDADCSIRQPGARCVDQGGAGRCLIECDGSCPAGFGCTAGVCTPSSGLCACTDETLGETFGCSVLAPGGQRCAGAQRCTGEGLSACEAVLEEACNEQDDDCDGAVDEDFRDDLGRYVSTLHCGGCATPCAEPGPNTVATCVADDAGVRCEFECEEGFVDVDGFAVNGCECERFDGDGPPPVVGGDTDCDGLVDVTDDFIYVTTAGSDRNPGTLEAPMRTIDAALARADREDKAVLVATGEYAGFSVRAGVDLFGGYRSDFRDRDLALFPVVLAAAVGRGEPVVRCEGVQASTRIEGFTVAGSDATAPGEGSTAMVSEGCGSAVRFSALEIQAGRGAAGIAGESSSDRYEAQTGGVLGELEGVDGSIGGDGDDAGVCVRVRAGDGGSRLCRLSGRIVSGGDGGDAECADLGCVNGLPCGNAGCTDFTFGGVCDIDAARRQATPNPPAQAGSGPGFGAAGESTYNAPTNRGLCNFCDDNPTLPRIGQRGVDGASGLDGDGGDGCLAQPFLVEGRASGGDGTDGTAGTDGGGGGGGSAGSGYAVIGGTVGACRDRSGGGGGGGGSGGCGAPEAGGGTGGGASIAVAVFVDRRGEGPTFDDVRVVTASGGDGGDGGTGAAGGTAGSGANGGSTRFFCSRAGGRGGDGGRGGGGGGGGGGCGGGSHAFFVQGDASAAFVTSLASVETDRVGIAGRGGRGGPSPAGGGSDGLDGSEDAVFVQRNP